jgi:hypothetical protein
LRAQFREQFAPPIARLFADAAGMQITMQVQQMFEGMELSDLTYEEQRLCGLNIETVSGRPA